MKILCLVSYNFLPSNMGGQKHIGFYYKNLAKATEIICVTTRSNDASIANYEVRNILSDSPLRYINFFSFFTLCKIINKEKITHLQIEHPYLGWLAFLLKTFCGIPLIIHSHNIEALRFRSVGKPWWRLLWHYEKMVHRFADFNLFITDEDRKYALNKFNLLPQKCITATYGIDWDKAPSIDEKQLCRDKLLTKFHLPNDTLLMLFNGTFSYPPNEEGLRQILNEINPLLAKEKMNYAIIICGKNIPEDIQKSVHPNLYIEGFVEDISLYFKGVDIFLNPVSEGGGIKTKLVEAIGYNLFAISYQDGAIGIPKDISKDVLFVVENSTQFAAKIKSLNGLRSAINPTYYLHFYWGNIIERVIAFLKK